MITFAFNNFIKINKTLPEKNGVFKGYDGGLPSYDIGFHSTVYSSELIDDSIVNEFGNLLTSFANEKIFNIEKNDT